MTSGVWRVNTRLCMVMKSCRLNTENMEWTWKMVFEDKPLKQLILKAEGLVKLVKPW